MAKVGKLAQTLFVQWFYKIQEPRVQRLLYLVFYCLIVWGGVSAFFDSPPIFTVIGGPVLVYGLGGALVFGGVLGAIAIVPGAWYLERVGIASIGLGIAYRAILILSLDISATRAMLYFSVVILLIIRFIQIKRADLAPIRE